MEFSAKDHTFAICAYGESPFLRECIESLLGQTIKTRIIMASSTDNWRRNTGSPCISTMGRRGLPMTGTLHTTTARRSW